MLCPACLLFGTETETTTTVEGTQYCSQHGTEALKLAQMPYRRGSASMPGLTTFTEPTSP